MRNTNNLNYKLQDSNLYIVVFVLICMKKSNRFYQDSVSELCDTAVQASKKKYPDLRVYHGQLVVKTLIIRVIFLLFIDHAITRYSVNG